MMLTALQELKWYQVREAFTDYKTYILFFFFLSINVPTGGLVTFAAQIVSGLGYSPLNTVLLGMPTGIMQSVAGFMVAIPQRYMTNKRCLSCAICCLVPLACSILIRRKFQRYMAYSKGSPNFETSVTTRKQNRKAFGLLLLLFLLGTLGHGLV